MNKFNPTALIEIENILSVKNIERLKNNFIKKSINPDELKDRRNLRNRMAEKLDDYIEDLFTS